MNNELTLLAVSVGLNIVLVALMILRGLYTQGITRQLVRSGTNSTKAITAVTYTIAELTTSIKNDRNLSNQERAEFIRLVLDVEKRLSDTIKDPRVILPNHTENVFHGDNAQVAQGQNVKQQ